MKSKSLTEETKKTLDVIGKIIGSLVLNIDFLEFIYQNTEADEREAFETYPIFWRMRGAFWSVVVLDLHKLFSINTTDSYRFTSLLNSLINNYKKINWEKKIEIQELEKLQKQISAKSQIIKKIKDARDQYIAHLDKNRTKVELKIIELKELLGFAKNTYDQINFALNSASTYWHFSTSEKGYKVFKNLSKYSEIGQLIRQERIHGRKTIETDRIYNIVMERTYS